MSALLGLFLNNILPIFLVAGAGFLLGKFLNVDQRALSRVIFYIFAPSLLFNLITKSQLDGGDFIQMMGLAGLLIVILAALTYLIGRLFSRSCNSWG